MAVGAARGAKIANYKHEGDIVGVPNLSSFGFFPFFRSGVTNTPRGGVVNCAQVKFLGIPFRSQFTLDAHPSHWGLVYPAAAGVQPRGA